jgi:hypothetical protein
MSDTLELLEPVVDAQPSEAAAPPPFESVKWRVKVGDKEYGPYPRTRLMDFLKEGRVTASTLLSCGQDTVFLRADQHPQLRWDFRAPRKRRFGEPRLEPGEAEAPVCNYFIAARLLSSHDGFERVLKGAGRFTRAAGDMWVLRSRQSIQQIRNQLVIAMKPHEHFLIVNATKDRLAWYNLGVENDIGVRGVWDSDDDA